MGTLLIFSAKISLGGEYVEFHKALYKNNNSSNKYNDRMLVHDFEISSRPTPNVMIT